MSSERWDESGRVWEEDHGLLDEGQMARCERADLEALRSPVPTRMVSNGEYMPAAEPSPFPSPGVPGEGRRVGSGAKLESALRGD